jgi:hypothetical protein
LGGLLFTVATAYFSTVVNTGSRVVGEHCTRRILGQLGRSKVKHFDRGTHQSADRADRLDSV